MNITFYIISGILVAIIIFLSYIVRNLLLKNEKYEDITIDQTQYLQRISEILRDSKKHLQRLDENGVFESDDEVGYFFRTNENNSKRARPIHAPRKLWQGRKVKQITSQARQKNI